MPAVTIPVKVVVQTITILVILPLIVGMLFRWKRPAAAKKATPFFSALGIIALLVLIIAGIFGLVMYFAGVISIYLYKYILPVDIKPDEFLEQET
jgi:ACR3 family arsenite efflux pump ArsB